MPSSDDIFGRFPPIEGSLARGLEPDPWAVLSPRQEPPGGRPRLGLVTVAFLVAVALVAGAAAGALAGRVARPEPDSVTGLRPAPSLITEPEVGGLADLVAAVEPAVVRIVRTVSPVAPDNLGMPGNPGGVQSGFLVDERGFIVTTASGLGSETRVTVTLATGDPVAGRVVRRYPDNDVAVVQILGNIAGLQAASLGRSSGMRVGDRLFAMGGGLAVGGRVTVAQGIVTDVHRSILGDINLDGLIQTDTPLGPAFTGGPVVNQAGQVVGMAVAAPEGHRGAFAMGIDYFRPFVDQVVQRRTPMSSGLKVATFDLNRARALTMQYTPGVIVVEVRAQSAGEAAGLQVGDVITHINDFPVDSAERFLRVTVTNSTPPDDLISLRYVRGDEAVDVEAFKLDQIPAPSPP